MAVNPFQIKTRKLLDQIANNTTGVELDDLLKSIDNELKVPLRIKLTATHEVTIEGVIAGNSVVDGAGNNKNRVIPPIGQNGTIPFAFTGAVLTVPATNNNNITQTTAGGSSLLNIGTDGHYLRIGVSLNADGNIIITQGVSAATLNGATAPSLVANAFSIGHFVVQRSGTAIVALSNADIYQYLGGGGGASATLSGDQTLLVNQTDTNITDLIIDSSENKSAKIEYTIIKNETAVYDYVETGWFTAQFKTLTSTWEINGQAYTGEDTSVEFDITAGGQINYTTPAGTAPTEFTLKWIMTRY